MTTILKREGLTEEDAELAFLRDVVTLATPEKVSEGHHQDAATALRRAYCAAGYWLDQTDQGIDSILDAAELVLRDLGNQVSWQYAGSSDTVTGFEIKNLATSAHSQLIALTPA